MNILKVYGIIAISALALFFVASTSCKKDDPTQVVITVQDTSGAKVFEASVRVFAQASNGTNQETRFNETKLSDGNGQASFDYSSYVKPGQAGFVVLDIEVTEGGRTGVGVVRVEIEKRNEKTIVIQ